MVKKLLTFASLYACALSAAEQEKYVVCFDIGDTIGTTYQPSYAIYEIGIANLLLSGLTNHFKFNPQQKMFDTLERMDQTPSEGATHGGKRLAKIHCDYMAGKFEDAAKKRAEILGKVDDYYAEGYYASYFEYKVVRNAINAMFDPEKLAYHQVAIEPMMQLFEQVDLEKCEIAIVSNWDNHSWKPFTESNALGQRIARLVKPENCVISGEIGINKPHDDFYKEVHKRFPRKDKSRILFIDNETVNTDAAQRHEMTPVHYTKGNHAKVAEMLQTRGLLKQNN